MSAFGDASLVALSDDAALVQLLDPPGDTTHARVQALVGAMYDMPFTQIHDVLAISVRRSELSRPAFPPRENRGDLTRTSPDYVRTDFHFEEVDRLVPLWVDLAAELALTLLVEYDAGAVDSILTRAIEGFTTLAQFRAAFAFIDLDAFMSRHGLTTVDDLRNAYEYFKVEIKGRAPATFNPADPANRLELSLNVSVLLRDTLDLSDALRAAKLARAVLERTVIGPRERDEAIPVRPFVPVVVFPESVLTGALFTQPEVEALFLGEGVIAVFRT
jgi:hypothetical protein